MATQIDYSTQIGRMPVIDVRAFLPSNAGTGVTNDTTGLQNAINTASLAVNNPCVVQIPRGIYVTTTALKIPTDGVIVQGFGMMGFGSSDNNPTVIRADDSVGTHDNTPMFQIDSADMSGHQWARGCCLRDMSFDVSRSARFTSGLPANVPPVIKLRSLSNCPVFENVSTYGHIGSGWDIATTPTVNSAICEGLIFSNCYSYGGYNSSGGSLNVVPTAPGVSILGAGECMFIGGKYVYFYIGLPVAGNLSDIPGIVVGTEVIGSQVNQCIGVCFIGVSVTRYVVHIRVQGADSPSTSEHVFPLDIQIQNCTLEAYNRAVEINLETSSFDILNFRSKGILLTGNTMISNYGSSPQQVKANSMIGGYILLDQLLSSTDVSLGTGTIGVRVTVGPNGSGNFIVVDSGANIVRYASPIGQPREILGYQLHLAGPGTSSTPTSSTNGQFYAFGNTQQLWSAQRGNPTGQAGNLGEICLEINFSSGHHLWICVLGGSAGSALWRQTALA